MQVAYALDVLYGVVLAIDSLPSAANELRGAQLAARAAEFAVATGTALQGKVSFSPGCCYQH